jgi:hypothetical protein
MKPKPFESLNHFTVPVAISTSLHKTKGGRPKKFVSRTQVVVKHIKQAKNNSNNLNLKDSNTYRALYVTNCKKSSALICCCLNNKQFCCVKIEFTKNNMHFLYKKIVKVHYYIKLKTCLTKIKLFNYSSLARVDN